MNQLERIADYINLNVSQNISIDRKELASDLIEFLKESLKIASHSEILVAGLGNGVLVKELAAKSELVIVVEQSFELLKHFADKENKLVQSGRVRLINGDLSSLPIDYYSLPMIVCVDYLDFQNVAQVLDEFKRVIDFEGILLFGGIVLHSEDIEGVYDELYRKIMPMHNDFYLPDDFMTVMKLKQFNQVEQKVVYDTVQLERLASFGRDNSAAFDFSFDESYLFYVDENRALFESLYAYNGTTVNEPYLLGIYRSLKPEKENYEHEVDEYLKRVGRGGEDEE